MVTKRIVVSLSEKEQRDVAVYIVEHPKLTIKQVAFNLGIPYMTVYRILREKIVVSKTLTLRD